MADIRYQNRDRAVRTAVYWFALAAGVMVLSWILRP